ncbi:MAG TPA: 3-oxoadipate enol-lactonase [Actinophytocola sp.]|uniref:3-oxoadipate enol-lactonase n=1 Tax=Actinophytocola sp. TaxID=1872138 RepID=UPI002DBC378A|nr:3-oxoadipate enol-lactonase [Actinophytocola sp.]HEU5474078.1 3-oxoadipate enol-lactonase [Actinophytocola sp.]
MFRGAGRSGAGGPVNVALSYTVDGPSDGPVLVLGNSLGTTVAMWEPQLPALTERFRVVRYDHRGHGGSPVPSGRYRLTDLGGDVLALLDSLGLDRVHLGGLSLGGMVAMWVAANAPDRVDRLALLCTSARLGPASMWRERAETVTAQGTGALVETLLGRWFTAGFTAARPDVATWAGALVAGTPATGYAGCCAAIETMDLVPSLGSITAPTLVIAGADDPATPPEHAEVIAAGIPGARLAVVPDAAHLANVEQPEAVTRLLLEHLEGTAR